MATKTIIIKGNGIRKEGIANEAITPGMLLDFVGGSVGSAGNLKKHATAGGNARPRFAIEQGMIGNTISDAYAALDRVEYIVAHPGDEVYALLASGENVTLGTLLESNGAGLLRAHIAQSNVGSTSILPFRIVAQALEAVNASGGDTRIRVEVC